MSILSTLFRDVHSIDRTKPVNLRITVDTRKPHPFAEHGRLAAFASRNGRVLVYVSQKSPKLTFKLKRRHHAIS